VTPEEAASLAADSIGDFAQSVLDIKTSDIRAEKAGLDLDTVGE